jgi:hypothetical protein
VSLKTVYVIKPIFFDAEWATQQVVASDGRQVGKFRDLAEAEAYLVELSTTPRHVPGQMASPELRQLANELSSKLRLRGGKWKRKAIEEEDKEDKVQADINLEIPF